MMLTESDHLDLHKGLRIRQGCYLDADTYLNKFRILAAKHSGQPAAPLAAPGETRFGTSSHR